MKASNRRAKASKGAGAKAPTLAQLEEMECYRRRNLEATADEVYAYNLMLPDIDADQDTADVGEYEVEEAMQYGANLAGDGQDWLDAYRALREAKTKRAA
jgi:hypothetical protein